MSPIPARAVFTIEDPLAPRLHRALRPEEGPGMRLTLDGERLEMRLEAGDLGDLRAMVNTHLRLLQVALESIHAGENP